jgi:hypothetical protein
MFWRAWQGFVTRPEARSPDPASPKRDAGDLLMRGPLLGRPPGHGVIVQIL